MPNLAERLESCLKDRYRLGRLVREGGTTLRFDAFAASGDRPVLLDVVRPDVAESIGPATLLAELRRAAGIQAAGMDPVLEVGDCAGLLFLVTPPVGETLRRQLERVRTLSPPVVAQIVRELAHTLEELHAQGEVDGHLSASRVVLDAQGTRLRPYAFARLVALASERAAPGQVVGALDTLSPEQIRREPATRASDVYALASLAFEMLSGEPPFGHDADETVAARKLAEDVPESGSARATIPPRIDRVVRSALARDPAERPASAEAFAVELKRVAAGPDLTRPVRVLAPAAVGGGTRARRRWTAFALTAAIAATAALAAVWFAKQSPNHPGGETANAAPVGLLVADFDGPPGDPTLAAGFRRLLAAHIDESGSYRTVPDSRIDEALARSGLPETTRVTSGRAFELADRTTVRGVITGTVQPLGRRLSVIVQAYLAENGDGQPLATLTREVKTEDELVPLARRMADELVKKLAPLGGRLQARRAEDQVETHSYRAYQALVRANERLEWGDYDGALEFAHAARQLDPECAEAEIALGNAYAGMGLPDSARAGWQRGLAGKDRLPLERQWEVAAALARLDGDDGRALGFYDRVLNDNPDDVDALIDRGDLRAAIGRAPEARTDFQRAARLTPLGPGRELVRALFQNALALGDVNAARGYAARLDSTAAVSLLMRSQLALYDGSWDQAGALAARALADPQRRACDTRRAHATLAAACAARGNLAGARDAWLAATRDGAGQDTQAIRAGLIARGGLYAWALRESVLVAGMPRPVGEMPAACLARVSLAMARHDRNAALRETEEMRAEAQEKDAAPGAADAAAFAEAWLGLEGPDASAVIALLAPRAVGPNRRLDDGGGFRPATQLVLGDAYVRAGAPDSARRCYEAILDARRDSDLEAIARAWLYLPVHARLARLELDAGDLGRANEHCVAIERALAHDADRRVRLEAGALRRSLDDASPGVVRTSRSAS